MMTIQQLADELGLTYRQAHYPIYDGKTSFTTEGSGHHFFMTEKQAEELRNILTKCSYCGQKLEKYK